MAAPFSRKSFASSPFLNFPKKKHATKGLLAKIEGGWGSNDHYKLNFDCPKMFSFTCINKLSLFCSDH